MKIKELKTKIHKVTQVEIHGRTKRCDLGMTGPLNEAKYLREEEYDYIDSSHVFYKEGEREVSKEEMHCFIIKPVITTKVI